MPYAPQLFSAALRLTRSLLSRDAEGLSLDAELMKSADTAMDYQLVTNLYRKQLGMFRAVLSRGGS